MGSQQAMTVGDTVKMATTSAPLVVHELHAHGAFGIVQHPSDFTFRVYEDGSLSVNVTATTATAASSLDGDGDGDTFHGFDGHARPDHASEKDFELAVAEERVAFVCRFTLARLPCGQREREMVTCVARLSAVDGVRGQFVNMDVHARDDTEHQFKLARNQSRKTYVRKRLENQLFPLTIGSYKLQGRTVADNGDVLMCDVELKLLANGVLQGTSRRNSDGQVGIMKGSWRTTSVRYMLQFATGDRMEQFMVQGSALDGQLRASWHNTDMHAQRYRLDRGILEFDVLDSGRRWSPASHSDYPRVFRQVIKLLLLHSVRSRPLKSTKLMKCSTTPSLPVEVWLHIFSFFDFHWFSKPGDY